MACLRKTTALSVSRSNETIIRSKPKGVHRLSSSPPLASLQLSESHSKEFLGKPIHNGSRDRNAKASSKSSIHELSSICSSPALRWWEKTIKPNMIEVHSAQELVDSLLNAGDRLVMIDFYSPGCGGCKALHPKISQLAESSPNAIFLKVNYEELKRMCDCLHIHVLPFFRFYRGAEGRLCSFSCTNATIKKFKDALAKHGTDRCNLGPPKGLDECEILSLASIGEIPTKAPLPFTKEDRMEGLIVKSREISGALGPEEEKSALLIA